jgi:hypothetical protein
MIRVSGLEIQEPVKIYVKMILPNIPQVNQKLKTERKSA